jgi:cytochrome c-type biogenesis protein CcmH
MTIGFWIVAGAMLLLALAILLIPLAREAKRSGKKSGGAPLAAIAVIPVSIGIYLVVTTFDPELADEVRQNEFAMLEQLAQRLSENPDDPDGWVLLGRSYMQLGDYTSARFALNEAWNRVEEPDDTLKMAYAQTMLLTEEGAALSLAGDLIEEVLQTSPDNQAALFYGGVVALERNQPAVAGERWTALLATNPPPEIADIIRTQLLALGATPGETPQVAEDGPTIELEVSVADDIALDSFGPNARVFILARGGDSRAPIVIKQPPPPLSALPGRFTLSSADAIAGMAAGRSLSQFDEVTVVARISGSGSATEQSGDAYAEATIDPRSGEPLSLVIDQTVP